MTQRLPIFRRGGLAVAEGGQNQGGNGRGLVAAWARSAYHASDDADKLTAHRGAGFLSNGSMPMQVSFDAPGQHCRVKGRDRRHVVERAARA